MNKRKRFGTEKLRRGIYVLPNIFTTLNLFCGFYAVISAIDGKYVACAAAIFLAILFDILDGKIARATNTNSKFGLEFDSLADLISFGLAPGLMMYLWALKPLGRIGWLAAFLYMVCGALRLARFNTQVGSSSGDYFMGLPIPAAAGMNAAFVLFWHKLGFSFEFNKLIILIMLYTLAFLMVSNIRYNSFKKAELFRSMNFNVLVAAILILIFIAAQPSITLFILGIMYVLSGPFALVWRYRHKKRSRAGSHDLDRHRTTP
jgi:CDP-diacylglycerol--serine O-phosphatidyltransferase